MKKTYNTPICKVISIGIESYITAASYNEAAVTLFSDDTAETDEDDNPIWH